VQDTIPICPARISQVAALGALKAGRLWVSEKVATLNAGRAFILEAMAPLKVIMGGTGAMYVMGKLPNGMDDQVRAPSLRVNSGKCCSRLSNVG
jgi:aspartate/methionine/tyrosine aminotransferase